MDRNEHNICIHCWLSWVASLVLCLFPLSAICQIDSANIELISIAESGNPTAIKLKFDEMQEILDVSQDPIADGQKIFQLLIDQINIQHGLSLSIPDVCHLIRNNIHNLGIPPQSIESVLMTLEILEPKNFVSRISQSHKFYWPWEWNWFGLNKNEKKESKTIKYKTKTLINRSQTTDAGLIVGTLEIIAGGSIAIVFGETIIGGVLAGGLIADGIHRISNKGESDIDSFLKDRRPQEPLLDE